MRFHPFGGAVVRQTGRAAAFCFQETHPLQETSCTTQFLRQNSAKKAVPFSGTFFGALLLQLESKVFSSHCHGGRISHWKPTGSAEVVLDVHDPRPSPIFTPAMSLTQHFINTFPAPVLFETCGRGQFVDDSVSLLSFHGT